MSGARVDGAGAETPIPQSVRSRLVALRRNRRQRPELAFAKARTRDVRFRELERLSSLRVDHEARTGLGAHMPGRDPYVPVAAIRGDIAVRSEYTHGPSATHSSHRFERACLHRGLT